MRNRTALAALAILGGLAATACAGPAPGPSPSASTATAPTPSATPVIDPTVLFTITVTATSPTGAIADLTQTVYKPVATTTQQAADEAALDAECEGWRGAFTAPQYLVSRIQVTDRSPAGTSWDRSVAVVSLNGWPSFSGEVSSFMSPCASVQVNLGESRGVTPVGASSDAEGGWATFEYGFGIATNAGSDVPGPDDALLSDCAISLSDEAALSAIASAWTVPSSPISCIFRTS